MAENKTKPTDASVEDYILSRASEQQRTDCHELMALLEKVTQHSPKMWGQASSAMARPATPTRADAPGRRPWRALLSVAANWWCTWMRKETDRSSYCPSLASTISASLVCTSRSWLISTRRCSSNSSPARSQRSGGAMGSAAAPNPSLEPTRLSSNVRNDQSPLQLLKARRRQ